MKKAKFIMFLFVGLLCNNSCSEKKEVLDEIQTGGSATTRIGSVSSEGESIIIPYFTITQKSTDRKVTYTYDKNGNWIPNSEPFTKNNLQEGETLIVEYIPEKADPITGIKDALYDNIIYEGEQSLVINFKHVNSNLIFSLGSSPVKGNNIAVNLWDEFKLNDFKNLQSIILEPKTIKSGSKIEITIDGKITTYLLEENLDLKENSRLVLTLLMLSETLSESLSFYVETVAWQTAIDKEVYINHPLNEANLSEDGELKVKVDTKNFFYRYIQKNHTLTETVSSVDKPFSWYAFNQNQDGFDIVATFTPDKEGNPEKDILQQSTFTNWGTAFNLHNMLHINSFLQIELVGGNFTAEEWNDSENYVELVGLNPANYRMKQYGEEVLQFTLSPQSINSLSKITVKIGSKIGNVFMESIPMENNTKFTEFVAGNKYIFRLSLGENDGFNLDLKIKDWDVITTSAEVNYSYVN
jgi:hypothetical protein